MLTASVLVAAPVVRAQPSGSGRLVVEPLIGLHYPLDDWDVGFGSADNPSTAGGLRVQFQRSYDASFYAEVLVVRTSRRGQAFAWIPDDHSEGDAVPYELSESASSVLGTVGMGSRVIDRNATGGFGLHLLFGRGGIAMRRTYEDRHSEYPHRSERRRGSALLSTSALAEVEITRRVLIRTSASGYAGLNTTGVWFPGATLMAGVAVAF